MLECGDVVGQPNESKRRVGYVENVSVQVVHSSSVRHQNDITCFRHRRAVFMKRREKRQSDVVSSADDDEVNIAKLLTRLQGYGIRKRIIVEQHRIVLDHVSIK